MKNIIQKRRTTVVNNALQYKIAFTAVAFFAFAAVGVWWEMYHQIVDLCDKGIVGNSELVNVLKGISGSVLYEVLAAAVLVWSLSLYFSHRIAGPLYRLRKMFHGLREGDFSNRVQFRKQDQLKNMAEDFNEAMDEIKLRFEADQNTFHQLSRKLDEYARRHQSRELEEISHDLKKMSRQFKI